MNLLNIVHGQKGGVGKSAWCKILKEYYLAKKWEHKLFDLDAGSLDVGKIYEPDNYQQKPKSDSSTNDEYFLQFTANKNAKDNVDIIFETATKQNVLVNMPSNIKHLYYPWMLDNGLLNLAKEVNICFVQWFVSSGEPNSIAEFLETMDTFTSGSNFKHVFVKNFGKEENWGKILHENKDLKETLESGDVISIDFPEFSPARMKIILEHNLTFANAIDSDQLNLIAKSALKQWLDRCQQNLNGVFEELKVLKPTGAKK